MKRGNGFKAFIIVIISFILIVALIGFGVWFYFSKKSRTTTISSSDLSVEASWLIGFDIKPYISEMYGSMSSDFLYSEFLIKPENHDDIRNWFSRNNTVDEREYTVSSGTDHGLKHNPNELVVEKISVFFKTMQVGSKYTTRSVDVYLCHDENDNLYLFVIG